MYTLLVSLLALAGSLMNHWAERRGWKSGVPEALARRTLVYLFDLAALGMVLRTIDQPHIDSVGATAGFVSIAGLLLLSMICFAASIVAWLSPSGNASNRY